MPEHDPRNDDEGPPHEGRPRLSSRDVRRLIRAAYAASFPYFLVIVLVVALATWILTTFVF